MRTIRPEIRSGYSLIQAVLWWQKPNKHSFWISTNSKPINYKPLSVLTFRSSAYIGNKQSVVLVTYAVMVYPGKYDDDDLTLREGSLFTSLVFFSSFHSFSLALFIHLYFLSYSVHWHRAGFLAHTVQKCWFGPLTHFLIYVFLIRRSREASLCVCVRESLCREILFHWVQGHKELLYVQIFYPTRTRITNATRNLFTNNKQV